MTTNYLRVLCVVVGMQAVAMAQSFWTHVPASGPSGRYEHVMAYDSQRGKTVMFGGSDCNNGLIDTWEWDGTLWAQMATVGPSRRSGSAMVFDTQRGKALLFGGVDTTFLQDSWEWDGAGWTQVATTGPSARYSHAMAYDSQRGRIVLFGGSGSSGPLGDTWEWNGSLWQPQLWASGPPARTDHAMAYDSQRRKTVMFGGSYLHDTWEWDGTTWAQRALGGAAPAGRLGHVMVYDSQRGRTALFGGLSTTFHNDTWEWDGTIWTQVASSGPSPRQGSAMAYDSQRGRAVLFGGFIPCLQDTWEAFGSALAATFGTGCGAPAMMLSPETNARPIINSTARASMVNVPGSLAFVALGWSRTSFGAFALPLPLTGLGLPGCALLQSSEAAGQPAIVSGLGAATYSLALPNWSGLIGLHIYLQGWAPAPGANPAGVIVSNGVDWAIGNS